MKAVIDRIEMIPMDLLDIGQSQVRTKNVDKGIEDLAKSIDKMGLLEPISVQELEGGRYEILTGQRRFLAHQHLGLTEIRACVLSGFFEAEDATAISLTENMVRQDISTKEYIDACTQLYRKYMSIKDVSDELGLPYHQVQKYVKWDQLVPSMREMVEEGTIKMDLALRATKAATDPEGNVSPEDAEVFAREMIRMNDLQRKQLEKTAANNPNANAEEVLETARRQPKQKRITVVIDTETNEALEKFATDEGADANDAAATLIEGSLSDKGYL